MLFGRYGATQHRASYRLRKQRGIIVYNARTAERTTCSSIRYDPYEPYDPHDGRCEHEHVFRQVRQNQQRSLLASEVGVAGCVLDAWRNEVACRQLCTHSCANNGGSRMPLSLTVSVV
jgi:hypothetical protein